MCVGGVGGCLATKMRVVLEYSSQGATGVKENRTLLVCILTLNSMFGNGACQPRRMSRPEGCIPPVAFRPSSPEGPWTERKWRCKSELWLRK